MDPFCQITIHFLSLDVDCSSVSSPSTFNTSFSYCDFTFYLWTLTVHQCLLHLHLIHRSLIVISLMPLNLTLRIIALLYIIVFLVVPIVVDCCDPHCTEHCDSLDEYALWFVQCLLNCALLWMPLRNNGGKRVGMVAHRH